MPLDNMIHFPTTISSLPPITPLAQTYRITAEVAVAVCLLPDLAKLSFSHVDSSLPKLKRNKAQAKLGFRQTRLPTLLRPFEVSLPVISGEENIHSARASLHDVMPENR
jgi:hypothetical protein